jgi:hypothetical protein
MRSDKALRVLLVSSLIALAALPFAPRCFAALALEASGADQSEGIQAVELLQAGLADTAKVRAEAAPPTQEALLDNHVACLLVPEA